MDSPTATPDAARRPEQGAAVLVVDDDVDFRDVVCELMADEGIWARSVASGDEALKLLADGKWKPGVIVLDLMMPGIDGWGVAERLARHPETAEIPIIATSGYPGVHGLQNVPGVVATFGKPVDLARLLHEVRTHLPPEA